MTVPQPTPAQSRSRLPAPEIIGGVIAVAVVAIVLSAGMAGGPSTPTSGGATARPPSSIEAPIVTAMPPVDPGVVAFLGEVNAQLAETGRALQLEVDRSSLRTQDVQTLVRDVYRQVGLAAGAVRNLGGALGEDEPGGRLATAYALIDAEATETLGNSLNNDRAYRAGGIAIAGYIAQLAALQEALEALLVALPPSPSAASPSASPAPSSPPPATASPPASASPSGSAAPSGAVPSGSASPFVAGGPEPQRAADDQIDNGGFEETATAPWELLAIPAAGAELALDPDGPATGSASARVTMRAATDAFAGISMRQTGLQLEAGRNYTLTLNIRAASDREIRIRVMPAFGGSYVTRTEMATSAWTPYSFTFTASETDAEAVLEIQLGRSTAATWVDTVSFRPTPTF